MTQEEMAVRLGVTAPAVNKWENGNSMPDITLLAPIARLLQVSLEELLSFREDLTEKEIQELVRELGTRMKRDGYPQAFGWAKEMIQQYPGSEQLLLCMGELLNAYRITESPEKPEQYDADICSFLERALKSSGEEIRCPAATSLFLLYFRKGEYKKAETYLEFLSAQNPERKRLQASVYEKTGRTGESCLRVLEQMLNHTDQMDSFRSSPLYSHIRFKEIPDREKLDFRELIKENMRQDSSLDFRKDSGRWEELMRK